MHAPEVRSWDAWHILSFSPVHQEIGQRLRLVCCSWLILDAMVGDLNCPLFYSSGCISASYDVGQWSRADDRDQMSLKIWLQSLGRHIYSIAHLLVVRVVLLGRREHFTDIIYRSLNLLCLVLLGPLHHHDCADHPIGCRNV